MTERMRVRFLMAMLAAASFAHAQRPTAPASACEVDASYEQVTGPWVNPPEPPNFVKSGPAIELTLLAGEVLQPPEVIADSFSGPSGLTGTTSPAPLCGWKTAVYVSTAGNVTSFEGRSGFGIGPRAVLARDRLARLESLLDALPDDGYRVPRPERRLLLVAQRNGAVTVRLYDIGNLPDSVAEIIRLSDGGIQIPTAELQADRALPPEEANALGLNTRRRNFDFLTVSPDQSIVVLHDFTTKTLTVYQGSDWHGGGLPKGGKVVRVIQETWQPPVYGGYWVDTAFTPDGRYLLVTWGGTVGALLYDTKTWEPVTDPNVFPQHLKEYLHAADWSLGVAVTESGEALIWDARGRQILSKLPGLGSFKEPRGVWDTNGKQVYATPLATIDAAAFSPDGTRVAIASSPSDGDELSLWDVQSGRKLHDLLQVNSGQPLWWNDGRWLLAPYDSNRTEGIWDGETGRLLGTIDLAGCVALERNAAMGDALVQACAATPERSSEMREWSVVGVQKQLDAFVAAGYP